MSSVPPFVKQGSTASISSSKSPKPSFRERYQLDSPSQSPRTPTGEEGFNASINGEETRSPSNHMVLVTSSKSRTMALHEVLLSRRERERPEPTTEQKKAPFSVDFSENRSSPRGSPRPGNVHALPTSTNELKDNVRESTPSVIVTPSEQFTFQAEEDDGKIEEKDVEDPVQAHLDRIMSRRKERAAQSAIVTQPEPTPFMDTPKREQDTNDKLQAIFEKRKNREVNEEIIQIGDTSSDVESSSSHDVGDIMNEFLKRSVENSRENSPVPSPNTNTVLKNAVYELSASVNNSETRESVKPKINSVLDERREPTPTKYMDHMKSSPMRGSPKMLRFKEEEEIVRPNEALAQPVSLWRITGERWKLYNISSYLSKEAMAILSNTNPDNNGGHMANNFESDTEQGESYNQYQKTLPIPYPSYPYDSKPTGGNQLNFETNQSQTRIVKFRNLEDLYQGSFEVTTDNGLGKRPAIRAELSGNFLRCLKTNQLFNQFLAIEDDIMNRMFVGREVFKNTPKGKVHKRFLFIDSNNKELVWSENEKKKTGLARSSRRIKLSDITHLKALEMTVGQAGAMKISVPYDKKAFGLVLLSRSRTAEFIITEKASEFFAMVVAIALAAHKYGSTI